MLGPLQTFDQPGDIVKLDPRAEAEVPSLHPERSRTLRDTTFQAHPQHLINHGSEGPSASSGLFPQSGGDVVFKCERCALRHSIMNPITEAS